MDRSLNLTGTSILKSIILCALAYIIAGGVAIGVGFSLSGRHPVLIAGISDIAATVIVFFFSMLLNNSSVYDPYWSIAPIPIALYFAVQAAPGRTDAVRLSVVFILVCVWGGRLTYNWLRGWRGLSHEDWRYVNIRNKTGRAYWPASFAVIHTIPTIAVFLGCLSLFASLSRGVNNFGALDFIAAAVTSAAIWVEARADLQLRRFKLSQKDSGKVLSTGIWAYTRHPNYFGEILFWWGLFLFSVSASPALWWVALGPAAITMLFVFIIIPMMEKHMKERRLGYDDYRGRTSVLIPWFTRRPGKQAG
jgi:steroid 5-alpha reductase family enzyme